MAPLCSGLFFCLSHSKMPFMYVFFLYSFKKKLIPLDTECFKLFVYKYSKDILYKVIDIMHNLIILLTIYNSSVPQGSKSVLFALIC